MKQLEEDTYQEPFLWILNQELWTQSELGLSVNFLDQTTSSSVKLELETTGQKVITPKEPNLSIQFLMLWEKKPKVVIVYKVFK